MVCLHASVETVSYIGNLEPRVVEWQSVFNVQRTHTPHTSIGRVRRDGAEIECIVAGQINNADGSWAVYQVFVSTYIVRMEEQLSWRAPALRSSS